MVLDFAAAIWMIVLRLPLSRGGGSDARLYYGDLRRGLAPSKVQGDQLYMAVCFWYLVKWTCTVYACNVAFTKQDTFYKVPEKQGHVYLLRL